METTQLDLILERLARVEAQNRRLRRIGGLVLILATLYAVCGAKFADEARVLDAEAFVLRGQDGIERARLGIGKDGSSGLTLNDAKGRPTAVLVAEKSGGAMLVFEDEAGAAARLLVAKGEAAFSVTSKGKTASTFLSSRGIALQDARGKVRTTIRLMEDDRPGLTMTDASGQIRFLQDLDHVGSPKLHFLDARGNMQMQLASEETGTSLSIPRRRGSPGVLLGSQQDGSQLLIGGEEGRPSVRIHATSGDGNISICSTDRKPRVVLRLDPEGTPAVVLYDNKQNGRFVLATKAGEPRMVFFDDRKRLRMMLTPDEDGTPHLRLLDQFEAVLFQAPPNLPERLRQE